MTPKKNRRRLIPNSVQRAVWSWQLKHDRKLTVTELAEKSNLAIGTIDRYLNDRVYKPNMETVEKLAVALEVSVNDLVEDVEDVGNDTAPHNHVLVRGQLAVG